MKTIFEGKLELESVDDGGDGYMFVRDEELKHTEFQLFENKLVRITIEVLEE